MPPLTTETSDETPMKKYWRGLEDLEGTAEFREFMAREFASALPEEGSEPVSRRRFLELMGAPLALAGLGGAACRWQQEKILPYTRRPAGSLDGESRSYATAIDVGGSARGLLVTSYDGRPIKIEGNPDHPASLGGADAIAQASILGMYDPDRSQFVVRFDGGKESVKTAADLKTELKRLAAGFKPKQGEGFVVLSEATSSPAVAATRARFLAAMPKARWVEYEAVSRDNERLGSKIAFGAPHRTHYALDKVKVVVSLDSDLFGGHPNAVRYTRDFTQSRRPEDHAMSRLYAFEPRFTPVGVTADHRVSVRAGDIKAVLLDLQSKVFAKLAKPSIDIADPLPGDEFLKKEPVAKLIAAAVADLVAHPGESVVVAGPGQPPEVHALAHRFNALLGNIGKTVTYTVDADRPTHMESIRSLVESIKGGKVQALVLLGGNPVYDAPVDVDFAGALAAVPTSIHLSHDKNETSVVSTWHVPRVHYLESWGDSRSFDGTYAVVQPLMAP
ncbi:MAG: TAT-variant-translocated molybdopterin oxidoreductase, partial [Planctomycetia bacterium]